MALSKGLAFSVTPPLSLKQSPPSSSFTDFSFLPKTSFFSSSSSFPVNLIVKRTPSPSPSIVFAFYSLKNKKNNEEEEYKFPDPIPEFAEAEIKKFRAHLLKRLSKKEDVFGDSVEEVVQVCTEIFSTFLHTEYGGPGTLLVIPFCDMAEAITEKGLPGSPQAARAAVVWAQKHLDKDWNEWTSREDCDDDDDE